MSEEARQCALKARDSRGGSYAIEVAECAGPGGEFGGNWRGLALYLPSAASYDSAEQWQDFDPEGPRE